MKKINQKNYRKKYYECIECGEVNAKEKNSLCEYCNGEKLTK